MAENAKVKIDLINAALEKVSDPLFHIIKKS
jgi:hypothetical protein